ncbi:MAG: MOSC N-terminal beta barrel domain-containing protein [Steroidobacteraceae bacterium]
MQHAVISALNIYPIKSCGGIELSQAQVLNTGLQQDRRWMLVNAQGRFVTQREQSRMALISPALQGHGLLVNAPGMQELSINGLAHNGVATVTVWRDQCQALDEGDVAAEWFSTFLGLPVRLVRFDDTQVRLSSRDWTGDTDAYNLFSDGFPMLAIGSASLADLNTRLPAPLPMNRFRPNIVLDGLPPFGEDDVHELQHEALCLRVVKPCTRCKITTTNQATGIAEGTEPLSTLMKFRRNAQLRGVTFGQNVIVMAGAGGLLSVGQTLQVSYRAG